MAGALDGLRVIEIGELISAPYAGKLLADMGADVIKVEPPGGDPARERGPFPGGVRHSETSGLFLYLNTNKRGITLDLGTTSGRSTLDRLVANADLVIHNLHPTDAVGLGVTYDRFRDLNPSIVMTSISPFGQTGPHADWRGSDVVLWSAGGLSTLNGDPNHPELPPLKAFGDQASFQAALNAAVGSLGALYARAVTGAGDHIDVSTQECLASILELTYEFWPYCGLAASRLGRKPIQPLCFMECRDGWIFICCVEEHQWRQFVEMMGTPEWATMDLFADRISRGANFDALQIFLQEWCAEQSVQDLYDRAQQRRVPFAPVSTMGDLLDAPHLKARGFFATVPHPVAGDVTMPGAPFQSSGTPWAIRRPAPCLGQHTGEVLAALEAAREGGH